MLRCFERPLSSFAAVLVACLLGTSGCALFRESEKDMRLAEVHYDLGVTAFQNGKYESAIDNFQKSIQFAPKFSDAYNAIGLVWWKKDHLNEAKASFEKAVQLRPEFSDAWNNLGALSMQLRDFARAKQAFATALSDPLYKTPYVARANLGWLYHMQGDDKQAISNVKESLATDETYCAGHKFLAAIYDEMGRKDDAADAWQAFARFCPEEPEAHYHLGQQQLAGGDPMAAARSFGRCGAFARKISRDHVFIKTCAVAAKGLPPLSPEEQLQLQNIAEPPTSQPLPGTRDIESAGPQR